MNFSIKMFIGVVIIFVVSVVAAFTIPVQAQNKCLKVDDYVVNIDKATKRLNTTARLWFYEDKHYDVVIAASSDMPANQVALVFFGKNGCTIPGPTGRPVTLVPQTAKIKAYIAQSKMIWENTSKVFLSSMGSKI